MNRETGEILEGEVVKNLKQNLTQMTPVSSSNVTSAGVTNNELIVKFHTSPDFYRYQFANNDVAQEAYQALMNTPSPGRWIWHNIRGHVAGEPVNKTKLGPAIHSGKPTIGGTTASLVKYKTSKTAPSRVVGYKAITEKLKRTTANPETDPSTGARLEGLLGARKGFREMGRKIRQDFTMEGYMTRSGEFDYRAEGEGIKTKTPENLKWVAENTEHVPVFGKRTMGSHKESETSLIGFAHNFNYIPPGQIDEYAHIHGEAEMFYDIHDLSDLDDPNDLSVSFGFDDAGYGGVQEITKLHHLAVSLNNTEKDRCSTLGGPSCTIRIKQEVNA
jgi:hypothetical protein